ncbi:MAG: cyclic nucleotide-binding domain-containing protein [Candidatus Scalindua sp.]
MEEHCCRIVNKKDNEIILEQGKDPYYAYVLLTGKANVYKDIDDKQVFVGTVEEGEIFGILSFIRNDKRSATVIANGDVKVGMILKETFMEHLNSLPEDVHDKIVSLRDSLFSVNDVKGHMLNCLNEIERIKDGSYTRQYFEDEAKIDSKLLLSVTDLMLERFDSTSEEIQDILARIEDITKEVVQMQ